MPLKLQIGVKRRADLLQGELIRFRARGANVHAIVLGALETGEFSAVSLTGPGEPGEHPYLLNIRLDDFVVSLGNQWVLEPVDGPECYLRNNDFSERIGAVVVDRTGVYIRARDPRSVAGTALINLATFEIEPGDHLDSVSIPQWRLWVTEDERTTTGAVPLIALDLV